VYNEIPMTDMSFLEKPAVHTVITLILIYVLRAKAYDDYWSEDFDPDKNCASEDRILDLMKIDKEYCVTNAIEDPHSSIEDCKRSLSQGVMSTCSSKTEQSPKIGELLYCHSKAHTTCCLSNFTCYDYYYVNEQISDTAARYLKNKDSFLANLVKTRRFKACYPIKGLDASKCAVECESLLKSSPLLEHCNKRNGLLKCCVRRGHAFCHECRYCCTLPFCSYINKYGDVIVEGEDILIENEAADQNIGRNAVYDLRATSTIYKGYDNRCLKPNDSKDPEHWEHYDPDDFYEATTKEMLDKAKTQKYDQNYFNFEDPEVLSKFINPNDTSIWQKTYGYDHVCFYSRGEKSDLRCRVKLYKKCIKARKSEFARSCGKENGFLKCCVGGLNLKVFHETRQHLYTEGLIKKAPAEAKVPSTLTMTLYCSYRDPSHGIIKHKYKSPSSNPIGGTVMVPYEKTKTRIDFRLNHCININLCYVSLMGNKLHSVTSRKEFCDLQSKLDLHEELRKVEGLVETEADCMKRKGMVRICPNKTINILSEKAAFPFLRDVNEKIKKYLEKKKSKPRKKKGKSRKKNGKRKKRKSKKKKKRKDQKKKRDQKKRGKKKRKRNSD